MIAESDRQEFAFYIRLPAILSDAGAVVALFWVEGKRRGVRRGGRWDYSRQARWPSWFRATAGNVDSVMAFGL